MLPFTLKLQRDRATFVPSLTLYWIPVRSPSNESVAAVPRPEFRLANFAPSDSYEDDD